MRISAARPALSAAIAMWRPVLNFLPVKRLTPRRKTIRAGTRTVEMRNARPRICSRYSRLATSSILRGELRFIGISLPRFE